MTKHIEVEGAVDSDVRTCRNIEHGGFAASFEHLRDLGIAGVDLDRGLAVDGHIVCSNLDGGDINRASEPCVVDDEQTLVGFERDQRCKRVGTKGQFGVIDRDRDGRGVVGVFADLDTEDAFDGLAFDRELCRSSGGADDTLYERATSDRKSDWIVGNTLVDIECCRRCISRRVEGKCNVDVEFDVGDAQHDFGCEGPGELVDRSYSGAACIPADQDEACAASGLGGGCEVCGAIAKAELSVGDRYSNHHGLGVGIFDGLDDEGATDGLASDGQADVVALDANKLGIFEHECFG